MFCMKCGSQFPDDCKTCPNCGEPAQSVAPAAPVAPVAPAAAPAATSYDIGGFMGDFFKSPIDACTSRNQSKHFLLGLTFPAAYIILEFIFNLLDDYVSTGRAVSYFFVDVIGIGCFMLFISFLYKAFSVKPVDMLSTFSWVGLSFFPYAVASLLYWLNSKFMSAIDYKVFSIGGILTTVAAIFIYITLYDYFTQNKEGKGTKTKALLFVISSVAVWKFAELLFNWMFNKLFF
ncbi:MAG: zinc ribbon domain-containing protein [Clostridiales bacterium]|nr:zinc ribbon domain-containing protein [Clostridiales bacterium]